MRRLTLLLATAVALAAAPAAYAQSQDVAAELTTAAAADTVTITLVDFDIQMPDTLMAGTYVFHVVNRGAARHALEIERDGEHHRLQDPVDAGEAVRMELEITPGLYTVYCPVGEHQRGQGMERALVVTARL